MSGDEEHCRSDPRLCLLAKWEITIEIQPREEVEYEQLMKMLPAIDDFFEINEVRIQKRDTWGD